MAMLKATKIKMHSGKEQSSSVTEIESIYLTGVKEDGFYYKENIHDFIVKNPEHPIHVNIEPPPLN